MLPCPMLARRESAGFRSPTPPTASYSLRVLARNPLQPFCHPERSESSAFSSLLTTHHTPLATKFFRMLFFPHPHDVTPIESHSCKKQGGGHPLPRSPITSLLFHTEHASDTQDRPQPQSCHAFAHTFRHTRGCTPLLSQSSRRLFPILSPNPHGTKITLARLHRCGGDVHA